MSWSDICHSLASKAGNVIIFGKDGLIWGNNGVVGTHEEINNFAEYFSKGSDKPFFIGGNKYMSIFKDAETIQLKKGPNSAYVTCIKSCCILAISTDGIGLNQISSEVQKLTAALTANGF